MRDSDIKNAHIGVRGIIKDSYSDAISVLYANEFLSHSTEWDGHEMTTHQTTSKEDAVWAVIAQMREHGFSFSDMPHEGDFVYEYILEHIAPDIGTMYREQAEDQ